MKYLYTTLFLMLFVLLVGCGNTNSQKNFTNNTATKTVTPKVQTGKSFDRWMTVKMNNEIEFQIPPNLEIQDKSYTDLVKKNDPHNYNILNAPDRKRMVAQQKGLNDLSKESLSHYVRAVVEIFEYPDEFPKFGEPLNFTKREIEEFGNAVAQEGREIPVTNGGKKEILKVVSVSNPAKIVRINGVDCILVSYDSKMGNRPIVKNDVYYFFNKHKIYRLMTMIRSTEYNLWTSGNTDIRNIVQTVKLAN